MTARLRSRPLRLAAAMAAAAVLLAWPLAAPASAENLTVHIESPTEGQRWTASSTVTIAGRVVAPALTSVDRIRIQVVRDQEDRRVVEDATVCEPCPQGSSVPFSHSTTLTHNGAHLVRVTASGSLLVGAISVVGEEERRFAAAVRPAAPTNLVAEALPGGRVKLSWGAVPAYPDLVGYGIYRGAPGAELVPIDGVVDTSYVDPYPATVGGAFQYQVSSIREGVVPDDASSWVQSLSNVATVEVQAAPVPTTAPGTPPGTAFGPPAPASPRPADLGSFFTPRSPSASSLEPPDTGFSQNLPYPSTTAGEAGEADRARRPVAAGAPESREPGLPDSNRRALLVPVAAGSVLCVAALHLRWLSRRLAVPALQPGVEADLALTEPHLELDADGFRAGRQPVGAGVGGRPPSR